ncbi:hypothetical protein EBT25_01005 [bacterium]|jgi:fatty-acid desaturase|nr:hypothetical protein [bacterium]
MIPLTPYTLLGFQVITHISVAVMVMYGQWYHWIGSLIVYFFTGCIGMSGTYHRLLSHRSYSAPSWWHKFGSLCGTVGGTGSTISWVATHREHHRFTDTDKDPHSPHHHNVWWVQFLSMFHPVHVKYVPDLLRSKFHQNIHKHYWTVHLLYALLVVAITQQLFSLVYLWLFPSFVLWHAGSFINTISHLWGTQDNVTRDYSTNNVMLGYLVWGEGWHNNHHADPGNYEFGRTPAQLDVTKHVINLVKQ